jgi:MtrB/PioB family decaheme-associated outer membrane protein
MTNFTTTHRPSGFRLSLLAASLMLAFGHAHSDDATPEDKSMRKDFSTPENSVSAGIGIVSGESRRHGMFSGRQEKGTYGLLDLKLQQRDDASGTWLKLKGRNLGFDNRELRFDQEKQGDWSYFIEHSRTPRSEPLIVKTGLQGEGTAKQTVSATAPKRDLNLKIERELVSLGARKLLSGDIDIRFGYKQETKRGQRMYGRGSWQTGGAHEFLTEPLDRLTRQWEVMASYSDKSLQLLGGYSGSSFENKVPFIDVTGGAPAFSAAPAQNRFALPPSNQAHQFQLSGGYNFSSSMRSTFRVSHAIATQNESLVSEPGFAPLAGAANSIDGKVVTTMAYADLSLRPADKLDLTAYVRYEDRDDQSPYRQYIAPPLTRPNGDTSGGVSGFRIPRSFRTVKGNVEGSYRLDTNYRLVGALEHEQISRNVPDPYRRIAFRAKTDETQARLELKRSLAETLNGAVAWITSNRTGSDYVPDTKGLNPTTNPGFAANQIGALLWVDRKRDKLRLSADWLPDEDWSLQFMSDFAKDRYSGKNLGPREGNSVILTADVVYRLSDTWQLSGWASYGLTRSRQQTRSDPDGPNTNSNGAFNSLNENVFWQADLKDISKAFGLGVKGKPRENLDVGADLMMTDDVARFGMDVLSGNPVNFNALPDYYYRLQSLRLWADHALDRHSGVRVNLVMEKRKTNDWTWVNYVYSPPVVNSDGTTVRAPESETTRFLGVSYHHRWR